MLTRKLSAVLLAIAFGSTAAGGAADITGKWTASFDTQIGTQQYTYDFVQKDATLTGKVKSNLGAGEVLEGRVEGDKVSFADVASEELVARRAR
jgi:hypothetical protein